MPMGRKRPGRKLWRRIVARVPKGTDRAEFWGTLRAAIKDGSYDVPEEWHVTIEWRNKEHAAMKSDDFASAMRESAESSRGWDGAILDYVEQKIDALPRPEAAAGKAGAGKKRRKAEQRSRASKKGWRTRRRAERKRKAEFNRRSRASKKGWRTRRRRT
jgi:hypothetical protein